MSQQEADIDQDKQSKVRELFNRKLSPTVTRVLLWENPVLSAQILSISLGLFIVFEVLRLKIFASTVFVGFATLAVYFVWSKIAQTLKTQGPALPNSVRLGVSGTEREVQFLTFVKDKVIPLMDAVLNIVNEVIMARNYQLAAQVFGGLLAISAITNRVSPLIVIFVGEIMLFSLPKIYESKEDKVDQIYLRCSNFFLYYYDRASGQAQQIAQELQIKTNEIQHRPRVPHVPNKKGL